MEYLDKEFVYQSDGNMVNATYSDSKPILLVYTRIPYEDSLLNDNEINSLNDLQIGDSFDKLYENGLIYKTAQIQKGHYTHSDLEKTTFTPYTYLIFVTGKNGQQYQTVNISIEDDKISYMSDPLGDINESETGFHN